MSTARLRYLVLFSILEALLTLGLKSAAYYVTGSVGLLSDALEGTVNLAGAAVMLAMLTVAAIAAGRASSPVKVKLPGGVLEIEWDGPKASLFMTGPATEVFEGEWQS